MILWMMMVPDYREDPIAVLNNILTCVKAGQVSQFYILPVAATRETQKRSFGSFHFGELNLNRLIQRSIEVGSDYHTRRAASLSGRIAVESDRASCIAIDFDRLSEFFAPTAANQGMLLRSLDSYFEQLGGAYFENFWKRFEASQELFVALGSTYLNPFVLTAPLGSDSITIFERIGTSRGFVAPRSHPHGALSLGGFYPSFDSVERELSTAKFSGFGTAAFHQKVKRFTHYLFRSRQLQETENFSEALLHAMIALESLLGDQGNSTDSVSRRTAVLVHPWLGVNADQARKQIGKLYGARSGYVHAGIAIEENLSEELISIAQEVLRRVIAIATQVPAAAADGFPEKWLTALDLAWISALADEPVSQEISRMCGGIPGPPGV